MRLSRPVFLCLEAKPMTEQAELEPADRTRSCRHAAFGLRRDLRGDLPDPGLRLRHRRGRRSPFQGRGARLHLFALRQPDRRHVRKAHVRAGRRRGCARHRLGHGGGGRRRSCAGQGRRPHRRGPRAVRLLPLGGRDAGAALRHRGDTGRRHRHRELGKGGPARTPSCSSWKARPTRRWKWSTSPPSRRSPTRSAPGSSSTTSSPRRCSRSRCELGAHIVVYSATKHIDGQGRCLGGVILSDKEWIDENLHDYFRHTGPSLSPFNAWTLLKGLETLPLRVRQQTESAGRIADFLAEQPKVARGHLSRPRRPSAGRYRRQADDGRLDADLPSTSRAASRRPSPSRTRWRSSGSPTISATPRA